MKRKPNTTVKQIVQDYLTAHGYDGLYDGDGCGCRLGDLFPCTDSFSNCMPGYTCGPDGMHIGPSRDWMPHEDDD